MAATHRAPKQWCLSKQETVNSFESWRQNILYTLSCDDKFTPYLEDGRKWDKRTRNNATRGFINDPTTMPEAQRQTAQQKVVILEMMLGQIANFCPIIARNTIVKNSTSLGQIWQTIRLHYSFQSTGAHFLDLADISLEPDERPEDLYQRLLAFIDDNLMRKNGNISHHGETIDVDEELSPSLENIIVLLWLQLIHKDLPSLIKQRYGTELRSRSLASIKPEISQALDSLVGQVTNSDGAQILRTRTRYDNPQSHWRFSNRHRHNNFGKTSKVCPLCKQAGRGEFHHFHSECRFLPESDKKYMAKARQIATILDEEDQYVDSDLEEEEEPRTVALRIQVRQSPYVDTFHNHHHVRITIDSGATGNMIRASTAERLGVKVSKSTQSAHQADGLSPLKVVGETNLTLSHDGRKFSFEGLVVENLDVEVLAGTPFMEKNDIAIRPAKHKVIFGDGSTYEYGSSNRSHTHHCIRRAHVLRAPAKTTTIWPGEFIELEIPESSGDTMYAVEPRCDSPTNNNELDNSTWPPPGLISSVARKIRIPNLTDEPQILKRNSHFGQILPVFDPSRKSSQVCHVDRVQTGSLTNDSNHSSLVQIDPDHILPSDIRNQFNTVLQKYDSVFDPKFEGYNGTVGPFEAKVNMGPVQPPQRKGRVPQYSRDKLVELQQKFDDLEALGVFRRPEDININVEYVNPSFLVKKATGNDH